MTVRADCLHDYADLKTKCTEALNAADKYIKLQDQKIELQASALKNAQAGYEFYKQKSEAWYRQPEFLIPVGLLAGFLIAEKVR